MKKVNYIKHLYASISFIVGFALILMLFLFVKDGVTNFDSIKQNEKIAKRKTQVSQCIIDNEKTTLTMLYGVKKDAAIFDEGLIIYTHEKTTNLELYLSFLPKQQIVRITTISYPFVQVKTQDIPVKYNYNFELSGENGLFERSLKIEVDNEKMNVSSDVYKDVQEFLNGCSEMLLKNITSSVPYISLVLMVLFFTLSVLFFGIYLVQRKNFKYKNIQTYARIKRARENEEV